MNKRRFNRTLAAAASLFTLMGCGSSDIAAAGKGTNEPPATSPAPDSSVVEEGDAGAGTLPPPAAEPSVSDERFKVCATGVSAAEAEPLALEFVLDASGSMDHDGKWVAAATSVTKIFEDIYRLNARNLKVGLIMFSDTLDCTAGNGPYPGVAKPGANCLSDVYPAFVDSAQLTALKNRVTKGWAHGGTPTESALNGAYATLGNMILPPTARRAAVLISDGLPNDPTPPILKNAIRSWASGIKTYSIGVGKYDDYGFDPDFMGDLAVAGGTQRSPSCDPHARVYDKDLCYYSIVPYKVSQVQLTNAFIQPINQVRGHANGCEYVLQASATASAAIDPTKVNVVWKDGAGTEHVVAKDDIDGWSYDTLPSPTMVILKGAACTSASNDPNGSVSVVIGCAAVLTL